MQRLRQAVTEEPDQLASRWVDQVVQRTWQLQGHPAKVAQVAGRCAGIVHSLAVALASESQLALGSAELREPLHLLSFTAGWMAGAGLPIGAAVALAHGLREAVGGGPHELYDGLTMVLSEAYAAGTSQQAQARHRAVIEKSQVVCLLDDKLPGLFLVGDPDRPAIDDAVGRLMMLAVMRQAEVLIVDVSGLVSPEETLPEALSILADHRREPPPRVILSAVTAAMRQRLQGVEQPMGMQTFDRFDDAIRAAREGR